MLIKKKIANLSLSKARNIAFFVFVFLIGIVHFSNKAQAQTIKVVDYNELEQIMSKPSDKVRVFNIWASWCRPCIMELPHFKEAQEKLIDKPVEFYFITMDVPDKIAKATEVLKQKGFDGDHFLLNEPTNYWIELFDPNWAGDIPYTVLIKSDGKKVPAAYVFSSTKQLVEFVNGNL